jgi:outer membrane protein TolC
MKIPGFILLQFFAIYALSQELSTKPNLSEIISYSIENSPEIAISRTESELNYLTFRKSTKKFEPEVNLQANYNYFLSEAPLYIFPENEGSNLSGGVSDGVYPVNLGLQNNFFVDLNFRQRLLDARYFAGKNPESTLEKLNAVQVKKKQLDVFKSVSLDYYQLAFLETNSEVIAFNMKRLESLFSIAKARYENDLGPAFDTLRLHKEIRSLDLDAQRLEESKSLLKSKIFFTMGIKNDTTIEFSYDLKYSLMNIYNSSTGSDPNQQLVEYSMQLNEFKMKSSKNAWLPTLDIYGDLYFLSQSESINVFSGYWNNLSQIGLQLNMPIYSGSNSSIEYQQLKIQNDILERQSEMLDTGNKLRFQKIEKELQFLNEKYLLEKQWTDEVSKALERTTLQYENDLINLVSVLEQQSELIEQQQKANEILHEIRKNEVEYLFLKGYNPDFRNNQ